MAKRLPRTRAAIGRQNKRRGNEGERHVRAVLETQGYMVTKAGGSLGAADLIAGKLNQTHAIQVKTNKPTRKDWNNLVDASLKWLVVWSMVWKTPGSKTWSISTFFYGISYRPIAGKIFEI